ncbi:metallophosphoesterase [Aureliella helgolandensis]|nr:metallophosphoesterase [Aureliella helgolandensis]
MPSAFPWFTLLAACVGNCGFWLYCFNRVNATGLPRKMTKSLEKLAILACFAIPLSVMTAYWPACQTWLWDSGSWLPTGAWPVSGWILLSLASLILQTPRWIGTRWGLRAPRQLLQLTAQPYNVAQEIGGCSTADSQTGLLARIPGNQITQLEVNRKELELPRPLALADGIKIGHLSDLHFTGQLKIEHYHFVIDRFLELEPDLIAITGDIIDYQKCLPWLAPVLGRLRAPLGCYFIFGNHDCRLKDVDQLAHLLKGLGHRDAGEQSHCTQTPSGLNLQIVGNERPWLNRLAEPPPSALPCTSPDITLRLGLSHSPDQIEWARRLELDVMLAGHTHGGQVRFPLLGPIVAPSHYGSRFASGVFYMPPTLMHVSRGVAGTHPIRWRCLPEVSLLTLRSPKTS